MCLPPAELFANSIWLWAFWLFHALKARKTIKKTHIQSLPSYIAHVFLLLTVAYEQNDWKKWSNAISALSLSNSLNPVRTWINTFASTKTETDICWWTLSLFTYAALWTASSELNRKWIPERIYRDQGEDIRWVVALYWNLDKQHLLILGHQWSHRYLQSVFISVMTQLIWYGNSETSLNSQITI